MDANRHMPRSKILNAFAVLDCNTCAIRVFVEARGEKQWNGACKRCGGKLWTFVRMRVIQDQLDYELVAAEAQADNTPEDQAERHAESSSFATTSSDDEYYG